MAVLNMGAIDLQRRLRRKDDIRNESTGVCSRGAEMGMAADGVKSSS